MNDCPPMPKTNPESESIAFIGGGNMARSLIGGLLRNGVASSAIAVAEPNNDLRNALIRDFAVHASCNNNEIAQHCAVLVLAVKPQIMKTVCEEIRDVVQANKPLLISIAAGIRSDQIQNWLGGDLPLVRSMPNTPALIGASATGLYANAHVSVGQKKQAQHILDSVGITAWIEAEELMDIVTALSGSGPAYFFLLMEALEDAAVSQGLPRETARLLVTQTCLGAGRMTREGNTPPAILRERVTSPGGTTQAALERFADGDFRTLVAAVVAAATQRGRELAG